MKSFPDIVVGNTSRALERTFFAVEATSFEQYCLWENHAKGSRRNKGKPIDWVQINPGWTEDVGKIGNCRCLVMLAWVEIEGKLILFWHSCSAVTDSRKSEKWLRHNFKKKWDKGTRLSMCDAQNFHLCLSAIEDAKKNE